MGCTNPFDQGAVVDVGIRLVMKGDGLLWSRDTTDPPCAVPWHKLRASVVEIIRDRKRKRGYRPQLVGNAFSKRRAAVRPGQMSRKLSCILRRRDQFCQADIFPNVVAYHKGSSIGIEDGLDGNLLGSCLIECEANA